MKKNKKYLVLKDQNHILKTKLKKAVFKYNTLDAISEPSPVKP